MGPRISMTLLLVFSAYLSGGYALAQDPGTRSRDFTGVWTTYRGARSSDANAQERARLRPSAQAKVDAYRALVAPKGETPGGFCVGTGMPGSMMGSGGYPMEIIQRPDQITIIYEAHNEIRRVYFGDRIIPPEDRLPERNGYSTGRWEEDTLVVETTELKEQVDQRYPHSGAARIVERYSESTDEDGTRVLTAEMTMTDPDFYTEPVVAAKQWAEVPNGFLMTYECTEPQWLEYLDDLARAAREGRTQ